MRYGISLFIALFATAAVAQYSDYGDTGEYEDPYVDVEPDAYGLGVGSDQYGRPTEWETGDGQPVDPIFQDDVQPDAYGPGVGMDPFGRPVRANQR